MDFSIDWLAVQTAVTRFFSIKKEFDFWEFINSPFFVTVALGAAGLLLQRRIRRDLETVPQIQKTIEASMEKTAETQLEIERMVFESPEAGANVEDFRTEARGLVQNLKDKINSLVAADTDQRHHRVYERLGRTDYKLLVEALFERGQLGFHAASALNVAFASWDAYARGKAARKAVPRNVIDILNTAFVAVDL